MKLSREYLLLVLAPLFCEYKLIETIAFSSDDTSHTCNVISTLQEILRDFKPNIVKMVYQKENQYQVIRDLWKSGHFVPVIMESIASNTHTRSNSNDLKQNYKTLTVFVMPNNDKKTTNQFLSVLAKRKERKYLNQFFIIVETVDGHDLTWLQLFFEQFWKKYILNVSLFLCNRTANHFTYNPFIENGKKVINVTMNSSINIPILLSQKMQNIYGHQLNITVIPVTNRIIINENSPFNYDGVDGNAAELVRYKLNALFKYPNVSKGILSDITIGRSQAIFNAMPYNKNTYENKMEVTNSQTQNNLCIIVPKAGQQTFFNNKFLLVLCLILMISMLVTAIALLITKSTKDWFLQKQHSLTDRFGDFFNFLFAVYQSFLGDGLGALLMVSNTRFIFIVWVLYSFFLTTIFTGKLLSEIIMPKPFLDINSIENFLDSKLNVITIHFVLPRLKQLMKKEHYDILASRSREYELEELELFASNRTNNAIVLPEYFALYIVHKYFDKTKNRPFFHKLDEYLIYAPRVYVVEQGSPYLGRLNELVSRFHQHGFYQYWESQVEHRNSLEVGYEINLDESGDHMTITNEFLHLIIGLLTLGFISAFVVLLCECIWHKYKEKKNSTLIRF